MTRSLPLLLCTLLCAALPAMAQVKTPATPEKMNQLYAEYWEDYLRENPIAATFNGDARYNDRFGPVSSAEERKQSRALSEKYLAASAKFDPAPLPAEAWAVALPFALLLLVAEEGRKAWCRRRCRPA